MTVKDFFAVLRKRLATFLVTFAVVFVAIAAYTFATPKKYTSQAELFATYSGQSAGIQNSTEMSSGASYLSTEIRTYPELAKTEAVLQPVISDLGLDMTVKQLGQIVTVTNPANTFMVDISVKSRSAQESADIANEVAANLTTLISSSLRSNGQASPVRLYVVQKAAPSTEPSSPNVPLYLVVALILGLVVGVCAALLKDALNTKAEGLTDVKNTTGLSSLGMLQRSDLLARSTPAVIAQPSSREAEQCRRIRTNISFLTPAQKGQGHLLVFTSTVPSEGKTTACINVAAAIAEAGKSVLVIDADLRRPSVAKKLGIEGHAGLSHILSNQATPTDVVQPYWKSAFQILPAGRRPANAGLLINSPIMEALVKRATTQYDYVLIDTAPLAVANDAIVFGRMADGVVMTVGKKIANRHVLKDDVQQFVDADVPVLGFILNYADPVKMHKNYYYYGEQDADEQSQQPSAAGTAARPAERGRHSAPQADR